MVLIAQQMLVAGSVDGDVGVADLGKLGCEETTHTFDWSAGVANGVIQIEVATSPEYAGIWANVATLTFDNTTGTPGDAPRQDYVRVQGTYPAMRHRVDGTIEGGTVTSRIDGSGTWG